MTSTEKTMVAIDGTDALAYVILRPGTNASGIVIEAAAKGISKPYAAYALRHTAQSWDPDDTVGADVGEQLKEALAEIEKLRAELEQLRTERNHLDGLYQDAEKHVGKLLGLDDPAVGLGTLACNCAAEPVHQTGCAGASGDEDEL